MDNPAKPIGKFLGAAVFVLVAALALYLFGLLHVYIIGWVVWLIESIFS